MGCFWERGWERGEGLVVQLLPGGDLGEGAEEGGDGDADAEGSISDGAGTGMGFLEGEGGGEREEPFSGSWEGEGIEAAEGEEDIEEPVGFGIEEAAWGIFFEVADKLKEEAVAAASIAFDFNAEGGVGVFPEQVHAEVLEARLRLHVMDRGPRGALTHPLAGEGDGAVSGTHNGVHAIAFQRGPLGVVGIR